MNEHSTPEAHAIPGWKRWTAAASLALALAGCAKPATNSAEGHAPDPTMAEYVMPSADPESPTTLPTTSPSTTVETPPPPATTTTAPSAEISNPTETLTWSEKRYLSEISGFTGLETEELKPLHRFSTAITDVTVLSADSAPLPPHLTMEQIERYVAAAERVSSLDLSHTVRMKLGEGSAVEVPFTLGSNLSDRQKANGDRIKHTIVISSGGINTLAGKPLVENSACSSAVNVNVRGGPHTVSLIDNLGSAVEYGQYAQQNCVATEVFNAQLDAHLDPRFMEWLTTANPDMSNIRHPSIPNPSRAQIVELIRLFVSDLAAISNARALTSAQGGNAYSIYADMASRWGYTGLPALRAPLIVVPQPIYNQFALTA